MGGIENNYIFELHKLQLEYLLNIDSLRDKELKSLGMNPVGKSYERDANMLVETTDDEDIQGHSGSTCIDPAHTVNVYSAVRPF